MSDIGHASGPRLSVRVLCYNYGRFLDRCLRSVLDQSFADFEVIVVDDASTDDSLEIARRFEAEDERISVVHHETNMGFVTSLLHSVECSSGEYEMQLDADDWVLDPDAFAMLVALMDAHPNMAFAFSPYAIHEDTELVYVAPGLGRDVVLSGEEAVVDVMEFVVPHSGTIVRMSAYRSVGGYPRHLAYGADMGLFYALCAVGAVGYIHRPLFAYRVHGSNMSFVSRWSEVFDDSVTAVESVFSGPLGARIDRPSRARRRALRRFLHHHPTQAIFDGRYADGWTVWLHHAGRMPILTVFQASTLRLAARTIAGARGYDWLRGALSRLNPRRGGATP